MGVLAPLFVITLFVLVRSIDLLIAAVAARTWAWVVAYGLVALLAFLSLLVQLGVHL